MKNFFDYQTKKWIYVDTYIGKCEYCQGCIWGDSYWVDNDNRKYCSEKCAKGSHGIKEIFVKRDEEN